ncbi:MAG: metallophosphoesterase [Planctomycetaceae bacterium]
MWRRKLTECLLGAFIIVASATLIQADEDVLTFFATSDSHYEAVQHVERNDRNRVTIERMNVMPGRPWPDKLGGGEIGNPRGILALGDLIDDGDKALETEVEWRHFETHFGLDGTDGLLKFPVYEGWGNHDGPPEKFVKQRLSVQAEIKRRNAERLEKQLISHLSENQLHYSWDWNGIHFVQTNLYPADKQNAKVRYSLPWHDPQGALEFVVKDLAQNVGQSGRPVIIMAHCGFDTDWWVAEDWRAFYDAVKPYNVVAYFHGHSGTGVKKWKPEGEERALDVINTGQTEKGFFVVEITKKRMRLGFQFKRDSTLLEEVEWDWKYLFEKSINNASISKPQAPPATSQPLNSSNSPPAATEIPSSSLRFAVIGDFGLDNYKPKTMAKEKAELATAGQATNGPLSKRHNPNQAAVADLVKSWKPAFVVTTGDNNYPKGEAKTIDDNIGKYYSEFIGNYRGQHGKGSLENRFFPVLGNHDWDAPMVRCQPYVEYFTLPGNERYYEFKQGPCHFFMLDTDGREPDGVRVGSKQHAWFVDAIATSELPFQIVVAHHPPFSSGEHGDIRDADWDFEKHGVDLVINGHDHDYERIERDGLVYIINGAGGANLRRFKTPVSGSVTRHFDKHGAMQIDVSTQGDTTTLTSRFIDIDGKEIDQFTIQRTTSAK